MATGFQPSAFQSDAFQIEGGEVGADLTLFPTFFVNVNSFGSHTITIGVGAGEGASGETSRPAKGRKARRVKIADVGLPNQDAIDLVQEMLAHDGRVIDAVEASDHGSDAQSDLASRLAAEHETIVAQMMASTPVNLDLDQLLAHAKALDGEVKRMLAAVSKDQPMRAGSSDASDDDLLLLLME